MWFKQCKSRILCFPVVTWTPAVFDFWYHHNIINTNKLQWIQHIKLSVNTVIYTYVIYTGVGRSQKSVWRSTVSKAVNVDVWLRYSNNYLLVLAFKVSTSDGCCKMLSRKIQCEKWFEAHDRNREYSVTTSTWKNITVIRVCKLVLKINEWRLM